MAMLKAMALVINPVMMTKKIFNVDVSGTLYSVQFVMLFDKPHAAVLRLKTNQGRVSWQEFSVTTNDDVGLWSETYLCRWYVIESLVHFVVGYCTCNQVLEVVGRWEFQMETIW